MNPALAAEIELLSSVGWRVLSHTEATASLETRGPFHWWIFLFALLFFFGLGALIYVLWWMIFARADVFLRVDNGNVVTSGDTWYVARQKTDIERQRRFQREAKEKGFWTAAGPSIVGFMVSVVIWFTLIWVFIQIID